MGKIITARNTKKLAAPQNPRPKTTLLLTLILAATVLPTPAFPNRAGGNGGGGSANTSIATATTLALTGAGSIATSRSVINDGTVDISGTSAGATIANLSGNGTVALGARDLTLAQADGIYAGSFTGSGTLIKRGSGSLYLNGDSSAFTGMTRVAEGVLEVGDIDHASAILGGNASVASTATLRGHGTILGNVTSDGTVAPSGSIGTLTINGNYTQSSTGLLSVEISPTEASQLRVGGSAAWQAACP